MAVLSTFGCLWISYFSQFWPVPGNRCWPQVIIHLVRGACKTTNTLAAKYRHTLSSGLSSRWSRKKESYSSSATYSMCLVNQLMGGQSGFYFLSVEKLAQTRVALVSDPDCFHRISAISDIRQILLFALLFASESCFSVRTISRDSCPIHNGNRSQFGLEWVLKKLSSSLFWLN